MSHSDNGGDDNDGLNFVQEGEGKGCVDSVNMLMGQHGGQDDDTKIPSKAKKATRKKTYATAAKSTARVTACALKKGQRVSFEKKKKEEKDNTPTDEETKPSCLHCGEEHDLANCKHLFDKQLEEINEQLEARNA